MTMRAVATLSRFQNTRDSYLSAQLAEYREIVGILVQGDELQSEQAHDLDDIMIRLKISDDDLSNDIVDTRQHSRLSKLIAEFEVKKPQFDKKYAKWNEVIRETQEEMETVKLRLVKAHQKRNLAGQPHNRNRGEIRRRQELESRNLRIFGPLGHDSE